VRVLGVDPGTQITGYGVIETGNGGGTPGLGRLIECGVFRFGRSNSLPHRLAELHHAIAQLIKRHQPSVLALEDAFYHKNVRTTLVLGHARGVILLAAEQQGLELARRGRRCGGRVDVHFARDACGRGTAWCAPTSGNDMIAQVRGRLAAKSADRVVVETPGGVGYEVVVPLGVMERLPAAGTEVTLATELVVREDGWALYGFLDEAERRFFQRLTSIQGVGPKIGIALLSSLGVERGARALREKNIALLSSVNGIGKKTAERLALELGEKVEDFTEAPAISVPAGAEAALKALERLGYGTAEADRAVRQVLAGNGNDETEAVVRRALQILTTR